MSRSGLRATKNEDLAGACLLLSKERRGEVVLRAIRVTIDRRSAARRAVSQKVEDRVPERGEDREAAERHLELHERLPERLPLLERRRVAAKGVRADEAEAQDHPDAEVGDRHEHPEAPQD